MQCPSCGRETAGDQALCEHCGAALAASEPSPEHGARRRLWLILVALAVAAILLVTLGPVGRRLKSGPPATPVESVLPQGAFMMASVDASGLLAQLRRVPDPKAMASVLADLDQALGVSLEKDILSWAGRIALTVPDFTALTVGPDVLTAIGIRDRAAFEASRDRLRNAVAAKVGGQWTDGQHKGVPVQTMAVAPGQIMAVGYLPDCVLVGSNEAVVQNAIDTAQGERPALAADPKYAEASRRLPQNPLLFCAVDTSHAGQASSAPTPPLAGMARPEVYTAAAITVDGSVVRVAGASQAVGDETKAEWAALAAAAGGVKGSAAADLPASSFAVVAFRNLAAWANYFAVAMNGHGGEAGADTSDAASSELPSPYRELFADLTGEAALGGAFDPGQGFGMVLAAGAAGADEAQQAAARLADVLRSFGAEIAEQDGIYGDTKEAPAQPWFRFKLCWTARHEAVVVSTHPHWLSPGTADERPKLPQVADAALLSSGHLGFLQPLLHSATAENSAEPLPEEVERLLALGLDRTRWVASSVIEPDGRWQQSELTLTLPPELTVAGAAATAVSGVGREAGEARDRARSASCVGNLKRLNLGVIMYCQDYDEHLPLSASWATGIVAYTRDPQLYLCPSRPQTEVGYAFNAGLSGLGLSRFPSPRDTVDLFESGTGGDNPADAGLSWLTPAAHDGGNNTAFVDGHVKLLPAKPQGTHAWTVPNAPPTN